MPMFCIFDHSYTQDEFPIDLIRHDPLDDLTAAVTAVEAHLVDGRTAPIPSADVVRLFVASASLLATPGRSAALPPAFLAWFAAHRPLCAEWGLVIREGRPWEVDAQTAETQLSLFPHLSRIFLRSMLQGWHPISTGAAS